MIILAIESSCDEFAVALLKVGGGTELIHHKVYSQISIHKKYGGVVPEISGRDHLKNSIVVINDTLKESKIDLNQIDYVAVTQGPGLAGSLMVGNCVAHTISEALKKPIIRVHHLEGHILSVMIEHEVDFPFIALLVSGGHSQIIEVAKVGDYRILGESVDDAAGEAFDKCAKLLGIPYPGGSVLSEKARKGEAIYDLPRPMKYSDNLNMSFSGLKTAVLNLVKSLGINELPPNEKDTVSNNICASVQEAIVDLLSFKIIKAMKSTHAKNLTVVGGVGANYLLREKLEKIASNQGWKVLYPSIEFCTDNAAMIAQAAAFKLHKAEFQPKIEIKPKYPLKAPC